MPLKRQANVPSCPWLSILLVFCCVLALGLATGRSESPAAARPNILWIVAEDINPHLGCYGDKYAETPQLDRFARGALRYRNCWSTAPVCAPARTSIITGVYPTSTGAEHMRSQVMMPAWMKMFPQLLREQGYYCSNNSKEDYNLTKPGKVWDESSKNAHWRNRAPGQPFFAVFNIEATHESRIRVRPHTLKHDPARAPLPAYHPDTPEVRHDWAQYYDNITTMDGIFASRLQELKDAGLLDTTIVFFYGDNGGGMPRSKRTPCNSGLSVPLLIFVPEKFKSLAPKDYAAGAATDRLVGFVDLAPTVLSLAGVQPPAWMQGHAFMGRFEAAPQPYLFGFRGRMDERYDFIRSVRNERYLYVRNYLPHLAYGEHVSYMFETPTTRVWKELYDQGKLQPPQTFFWQPKPPEELYDLQTDRDEVKNLAASPAHQEILKELRQAHLEHVARIRDVGFLAEPELHSRPAGSTPYELGHDDQKYPFARILAMAELASQLKPEALPRLRDGLKDTDSAVRYWAAMGLLMRGAKAVERSGEELRLALEDKSPSVRIAAATALGKFGSEAQCQSALSALKELAPPDQNSIYVSMLALNAVEVIGKRAEPLVETIQTMPMAVADPGARGNNVPRLVTHLSGRTDFPEGATRKGNKARKRASERAL